MAASLTNYIYTDAKTGNYYTGQVVADPTGTQYAYQPNSTYTYGGGTYTTGTSVPTTAPIGTVYQTNYYDKASAKLYDSWHYSPKSGAYYDVAKVGYDTNTGLYTPPATPATTPGAPTTPVGPVAQWSGNKGLGSEYSYVQTDDGKYHVYGGGGSANAQITPSTLGVQAYDYKFIYPDGKAYYLGKVYDDGTYGYKVGDTIPKAGGTYQIYANDPVKPLATDLAGYTYTSLYHDAAGTDYAPGNIITTSPYYNKPTGYGGLGSETDWVQKPGGWYKFDNATPSTASTAVAAIPLPA